MLLNNLLNRILHPNTHSSSAFVCFLKKHNVEIGEGCFFFSPNDVQIDLQRAHMLKIGNNVCVTSGVVILSHDYSRCVLCNADFGNVGEGAFTSIGDNVFIGKNSIILMGTNIGNNSIVGAGSVCSGKYPPNSVIAGNPAKVLMSLEDFYEKRKKKELDAAIEYARFWEKKYGRYPTIIEMTNAFSWIYLPHTSETISKYPSLFCLHGVDKEKYLKKFLETKPLFQSYEEFLNKCCE